MNERQRDLFLYLWSRRRTPGQMAISLRGALIGALGGVLFTLMLSPGASVDVPAYDTGGQLFGGLAANLRMLALAVPAFGLIGFIGANRVYAAQETMYQSMLASGAQVPSQKPVMSMGDRGPAIAVGIAVAVIIGFILFVAITLG